MIPPSTGPLEAEFRRILAKNGDSGTSDPDACLLWPGSRTDKGYGRILDQKRPKYAHRVAWELVNGPIPSGVIVCHACDTPACVNVRHLFLGSNQDNTDDRMSKGRFTQRNRRFPAAWEQNPRIPANFRP